MIPIQRRPRPAARILRALTACAAMALLPATARAGKPRPDVVVISIDCLRPDHMSAFGYRRRTTPGLDEFFKTGVRYSNALSVGSHTRPVHMSLFTGVFPSVHNVAGNSHVVESPPATLPTMAAIFKGNGYETAAFVGGVNVGAAYGFARSFDVFKNMEESRLDGNLTDFDDSAVMSWLSSRRGGPLFLFLHTNIPHLPYLPPEEFNVFLNDADRGPLRKLRDDILGDRGGETPLFRDVFAAFKTRFLMQRSRQAADLLADLYDGDVLYADHCISALLGRMESLGLLKNAVVVVLSDHGEELLEHGRFDHQPRLYDELMRVTLFIRPPDGTARNRLVSDSVSLIDVPPTILRLAGLPVPPHFQGLPLPPFKGGRRRRDPVIAEVPGPRGWGYGARTRDWKLIVTGNEGWEFFDLAADPGEQRDLAKTPGAAPRPLGLLVKALESHRESCENVRRRFDIPPYPWPPKDPPRNGGAR